MNFIKKAIMTYFIFCGLFLGSSMDLEPKATTQKIEIFIPPVIELDEEVQFRVQKAKKRFVVESLNVITFGTFGFGHVGHLNIFERARLIAGKNGKVIVGVSSDKFNYVKKNRHPMVGQDQFDRARAVQKNQDVNTVFFEEAMDLKIPYIKNFKVHVLVMGGDWKDRENELFGCENWQEYTQGPDGFEVIILPRTEGISTSEIIESIKDSDKKAA